MSLRKSLMVFLACLGPTACALHPAPPPRWFGLTALCAQPAESRPRAVPLVVGPVDLPAYTRRAQLLTLLDTGEFRASPTGRWAESLEQNVTRVLAENFSRVLATSEVSSLDASPPGPRQQLSIQITEFVATAKGEVAMTAYWRIFGIDGRKREAGGKFWHTEVLADASDAAIAGALSRALAALAEALAEPLRAADTACCPLPAATAPAG